jgi:hypothetical protein
MKPFTVVAIVVFILVSLLHLLRYFLGWEVMVNTVTIPMWVSLPGFVIAGGLAFMLWREMK